MTDNEELRARATSIFQRLRSGEGKPKDPTDEAAAEDEPESATEPPTGDVTASEPDTAPETEPVPTSSSGSSEGDLRLWSADDSAGTDLSPPADATPEALATETPEPDDDPFEYPSAGSGGDGSSVVETPSLEDSPPTADDNPATPHAPSSPAVSDRLEPVATWAEEHPTPLEEAGEPLDRQEAAETGSHDPHSADDGATGSTTDVATDAAEDEHQVDAEPQQEDVWPTEGVSAPDEVEVSPPNEELTLTQRYSAPPPAASEEPELEPEAAPELTAEAEGELEHGSVPAAVVAAPDQQSEPTAAVTDPEPKREYEPAAVLVEPEPEHEPASFAVEPDRQSERAAAVAEPEPDQVHEPATVAVEPEPAAAVVNFDSEPAAVAVEPESEPAAAVENLDAEPASEPEVAVSVAAPEPAASHARDDRTVEARIADALGDLGYPTEVEPAEAATDSSGEEATPVLGGVVPRAPHPGSLRPLPRILAIANQKGGVGKTTTAVNLGASLADLDYRVLVVDLDPQGNATTGLGINARSLESSIYDVILHDVPPEDVIEPTTLRNLFVMPATIDLAGAEIELVPVFSRELRLRRALDSVKEDYDFILIDCPPSLGLLTINGLAAAGEVAVPIQCEYYALEGLSQLLRNVGMVQSNLNAPLEMTTIILTMYDARTRLAEQVVKEVRDHFGDRVCRNVVPRTVRLSEAPSFGQPIIVFDSSSRGSIAYRELAKEVSGGASQRVR